MPEQVVSDFWERQDAICHATLTGGREESTLKALLFAINRFAGFDGDCFVSVEELGNAAGISRRTRQQRMQDLYQLGVIRMVVRGGGSGQTNHIAIDLDNLRKLDRTGATSAPVSLRRSGAISAPVQEEKRAQSLPGKGAVNVQMGRNQCAGEIREVITKREERGCSDGFSFPLLDGNSYWVSSESITEFAKSHPNVNVTEELLRAQQWCNDNPRKRKTGAGMPRFLNGWLRRANNSASDFQRSKFSGPVRGSSDAGEKAWQRVTKAVKQFDPLHESDEIRKRLTNEERAAARAVGGLPTIAGRDRYNETKLRTAFLEAYSAAMAALAR